MNRPSTHRRPSPRTPRLAHRAATCWALALAVHGVASKAVGDEPPAQVIDWNTSPLDLDLRGMNGERYTFDCPPGKPQSSRVTGSGPYADDSSICSAAVHAGVLHARTGGVVSIEIRPGENRYVGSERHYLHSAGDDRGWSGSFVVLATDDASHALP
jgi:hypothetical protein